MNQASSSSDTSSNKLSAKEGNWQQLANICQSLRQASLSAEELAQLDPSADTFSKHLLLLLNNQPVACARLSATYQLEAVAVLEPLKNKGLEEQLEKLAEAKAKAKNSLGAIETSLALQEEPTHFSVADLQTALAGNEALKLKGKEQIDLALTLLINLASKFIYFQAISYPPRLLNEDQAFVLASLARKHPLAQVSFLLEETSSLTNTPNALLKVYQRASSNFAIYQNPLPSKDADMYLLIDEAHLLTWPNPKQDLAWLHPNASREAYRFLTEFKDKWPRATEIKGLHDLTI